ncbi:MAG: hypothetical protein SGBAC_007107 [Bacillariaceae sp.]
MTSYHYYGNEGETIPESVSELDVHGIVQFIPVKACARYRHLTRVNFIGFESLKIIGRGAFSQCPNLRGIDIPPSLNSIEDEAFQGCQSLQTVWIQDIFDDTSSSFYLSALTTIGRAAFGNCSSLTGIRLPSSVETIRANAFVACKCLETVSLFRDLRQPSRLKVMDGGVFANCVKLQKVDLPRALEVLGNGVFYNCVSLKEVNIEEGNNLRVIGSMSFCGCVKLQSFNNFSMVERIEKNAFRNCDSLEVIRFQNGLKYVDGYAFCSCKNLRAVALVAASESVALICSFAFAGCPKLVSVELGDSSHNAVAMQHGAFSECESLVNICLPSECKISKPLRSNQGYFDNVDMNSFRGCTALENEYGKEDISTALMHRFDNFCIHKKCYHASVTTAEELALEIESSTQSSQDNTGNPLVDPFGMTPFHVLLSAASCRIDLLRVLLDAYPPAILGCRDSGGKTALEYLTHRRFLSEDTRSMLRIALEWSLVDRLSSWRALDAWISDMSGRVNAIVAADEMEQRQSLLEAASMVLSRYERVESTTLLELYLWKMKLTPVNAPGADDATSIIVVGDDRGAYRIRSGASVVIPNVMTFL